MLVPSAQMFRNPGDYSCARATFGLLTALFTGMTTVATIVYWKHLLTADRTIVDKVDMATPLSVYICEDAKDVRDESSMLPFLEAGWIPATRAGYGKWHRISGTNCTITYDGSDLRCVRFRVKEGLPGHLPTLEAGHVTLRVSQPPSESRKIMKRGRPWMQGLMIKVSLADDAINPVALREEIFRTTNLPLATNVSRVIEFTGQRKRQTYSDSLGGRFGATVDDTFFFDVAGVSCFVYNHVQEYGGVPYPWKIKIMSATPGVVHLHDVNDMIGNTLTFLAQIISFLALFKIMVVLFVADELPRQFRFYIPSLGLGLEAKAEQQPLVSSV